MYTPFYEKTQYPRFDVAPGKTSHMMEIVNFLKWVVNRDRLEIANYFDAMGQGPFFLVAATGLGKTVGVPIHILIRQIQNVGQRPDPQPRVWIVEPRIPIAIGQVAFMNSLWKKYTSTKGKNMPPLFGCITSTSGNVNPDAPIKFVTTGIFELMAKDGQLTPERDRVVIDEAHVTIEQNPGVELGIALVRQAGVTVDYMSATVDIANLKSSLGLANIINADKQRFTVWKHNLLNTASKSLPDLIRNTLIVSDPSSQYYPQPSEFSEAAAIRTAVTEPGRSHGMLVVVNSFAGDYSDTQKLARIIRDAHPELPVLQLASEVIRDPKRMQEYERALKQIERDRQNYVILATSVVEMGITFPTLDYVVTMDSGYEQETIGNVTFPVVAPLGVNSLLQRIGRVGRKRPGIAYIANEIGADYAELDDDALNGKHTLAYEPISFPLAGSSLMPLAYYAHQRRWQDIDSAIAKLNLPSGLHKDEGRMAHLHEQVDTLRGLGLVDGSALTPLGVSMEKWIGQSDLAYAVQLQRRLDDPDTSLPDIMFWIVVTALSSTPIVTLRAPHDFFIDRDGSHSDLPHTIDAWSHAWLDHEDVSAFMMFAEMAARFPRALFEQTNDHTSSLFERRCACGGIDARKLVKAAQAVKDTWKLFCRVNGEHPRFRALFGDAKSFKLGGLPWQMFRAMFPQSESWHELYRLPSQSPIRLTFNETIEAFEWEDTLHGHTGTISQDDTPIPLREGDGYIAIVTPSRKTKGDKAEWRISHLGL